MATTSGLKLKAYWLSQCDGSLPSYRCDMRPEDMKSFLSDLIIAEISDDEEFRIRLAGTRVVRRLDRDPTSARISSATSGVIGGLATLIDTCKAGAGPVSGCIPYPDGVESFDAVNCTVLPMRDKSGEICQFIMALDFVFAATSLLRDVRSDNTVKFEAN